MEPKDKEELLTVTRLPMDPSDINPTRTQACPQMFVEENSQEMPGKPDVATGGSGK